MFFFVQNKTDQQPFSESLDNRVNTNMNNVEHIDYCNKDWTYDNDFTLSRFS